MKLLAQGIQNLELELTNFRIKGHSQNVKKLQITSSVITTDILIKPQQFPTSSF